MPSLKSGSMLNTFDPDKSNPDPAVYVVPSPAVSVAVVTPVRCPNSSTVTFWIYVLPVFEVDARDEVSAWLNAVPVKSKPLPLAL